MAKFKTKRGGRLWITPPLLVLFSLESAPPVVALLGSTSIPSASASMKIARAVVQSHCLLMRLASLSLSVSPAIDFASLLATDGSLKQKAASWRNVTLSSPLHEVAARLGRPTQVGRL
eukprot:g59102.t1